MAFLRSLEIKLTQDPVVPRVELLLKRASSAYLEVGPPQPKATVFQQALRDTAAPEVRLRALDLLRQLPPAKIDAIVSAIINPSDWGLTLFTLYYSSGLLKGEAYFREAVLTASHYGMSLDSRYVPQANGYQWAGAASFRWSQAVVKAAHFLAPKDRAHVFLLQWNTFPPVRRLALGEVRNLDQKDPLRVSILVAGLTDADPALRSRAFALTAFLSVEQEMSVVRACLLSGKRDTVLLLYPAYRQSVLWKQVLSSFASRALDAGKEQKQLRAIVGDYRYPYSLRKELAEEALVPREKATRFFFKHCADWLRGHAHTASEEKYF